MESSEKTATIKQVMPGLAVFIFRRDFRLEGNPAWERCARWSIQNRANTAACFVFSDRQTDARRNPYFSRLAYSAMLDALEQLDRELDGRLSRFRVRAGKPDTILLDALADAHDVRAVFFNSDVTPFATRRDAAIGQWCRNRGVLCDPGLPGEGYLLWPAGAVLTSSGGSVPKNFATFHRYTENKKLPESTRPPHIVVTRISPPAKTFQPHGLPVAVPLVGVPDASKVIRDIENGLFDNYNDTRHDYRLPSTRLSVHLKFGRIDPVRAMAAARSRHISQLQRQLLWREFYYHLAAGYPDIITSPNQHIRPDRNSIRWKPVDRAKADMWFHGKTGQPLVDDAMAELKRSGFLHNRLRMIVSSYFVKDLGLDWREGERLFATALVDYDPALNSGGWQSTDSQIKGQEIKASTQTKKYGPLFLKV